MRDADSLEVRKTLARIEDKVDTLIRQSDQVHREDKTIRSLCDLKERLAVSLRDTYVTPAEDNRVMELLLVIASQVGIKVDA